MSKSLYLIFILLLPGSIFANIPPVKQYHRLELTFTSSLDYMNPFQQIELDIVFNSPSGREKIIRGFWDGKNTWKARFMPDECGSWSYETICSDTLNQGLHDQKGAFKCVKNNDIQDIYVHGPITRQPGAHYLTHEDGTPFFWLGCTAWNGVLKSTAPEWNIYLDDRKDRGYDVIQFASTQWRGCAQSDDGLVAFDGIDTITIHPGFFKRMDQRVDEINKRGLVAAPVILWSMPLGSGRDLNPGYYLPDTQAILLAKYIVARYGGNHVAWILGGDGDYNGKYEKRWKTIGRAVFEDNKYQGIVMLHPKGGSWIGETYEKENWLDIIGYQSGHSNSDGVVNGITRGQVTRKWPQIAPRPMINLEPVYEQIRPGYVGKVIRNACYWSLFSAPVAGVTYGANGIWPWIRKKGDSILNHAQTPWTFSWEASLSLPGSVQMGYLARFFRKLPWWQLYPAQELLIEQPGDKQAHDFVSVLKASDNKLILVYFPGGPLSVSIRKRANYQYSSMWFNPSTNSYTSGIVSYKGSRISIRSVVHTDMIFVMEAQ